MAEFITSMTGTMAFGTVRKQTEKYRSIVVHLSGVVSGAGTVTLNDTFPSQITLARIWVEEVDAGGIQVPGTLVNANSKAVGGGTTHLRFWVPWKGVNDGDDLSTLAGSFQITCDTAAGGAFTLNLTGLCADIPLNLVMVLDRSGSMDEDAGGGEHKVKKLQRAALTGATLMRPSDQLEVVSFDDVVEVPIPVAAVSTLGAAITDKFTPGVFNAPPNLQPRNGTAIGDGLFKGNTDLGAAAAGKAILLATDGMDNSSFTHPIGSFTINNPVFGIGIGIPGVSIDDGILGGITAATGGYLVVTGAVTALSTFALEKFLLGIIADASELAVITDPDGTLTKPGFTQVIPFEVSQADSSIDVILLNRSPELVRFALRTPGGQLITPATAGVEPAVQYVQSSTVTFYRISLPALHAHQAGSHAGTWLAGIALRGDFTRSSSDWKDEKLYKDDKAYRKMYDNWNRFEEGFGAEALYDVTPTAVPYSLLVHSQSDIELQAFAHQHSKLPGSDVRLVAKLFGQGIALSHANVTAEITGPDGNVFQLVLVEHQAGRYQVSFSADSLGVYKIHFRAAGKIPLGSNFQREKVITASIYLGPPTVSVPPSEEGKPGTTGTGGTRGGGGTHGGGTHGGGKPGDGSHVCCCCAHSCKCHGAEHHHHHGCG